MKIKMDAATAKIMKAQEGTKHRTKSLGRPSHYHESDTPTLVASTELLETIKGLKNMKNVNDMKKQIMTEDNRLAAQDNTIPELPSDLFPPMPGAPFVQPGTPQAPHPAQDRGLPHTQPPATPIVAAPVVAPPVVAPPVVAPPVVSQAPASIPGVEAPKPLASTASSFAEPLDIPSFEEEPSTPNPFYDDGNQLEALASFRKKIVDEINGRAPYIEKMTDDPSLGTILYDLKQHEFVTVCSLFDAACVVDWVQNKFYEISSEISLSGIQGVSTPITYKLPSERERMLVSQLADKYKDLAGGISLYKTAQFCVNYSLIEGFYNLSEVPSLEVLEKEATRLLSQLPSILVDKLETSHYLYTLAIRAVLSGDLKKN